MDEKVFEQHIETWSKAPREEKESYYAAFLWPEVRRRFATLPPPERQFNVLIIPVSNPYTAILHLDYYRPKVAVFLYTAFSRRQHAQELERAARELQVSYDDNGGEDIDERETLSVYQAVKRAFARYSGAKMAIDVTGGTKAMSVGAAMAGSVIGADSIYIESSFDKHIQDRRPGTERPCLLPDPFVTLGDIQRERAFRFYAEHDYATAQELFSELAERIQPPQGDAQRERLAAAYAAWDAFNLPVALAYLSDLLAELDAAGWPILRMARDQLRFQHEALGCLTSAHISLNASPFEILETNPAAVRALLGSLYSNAMRREQQGRYDVAALLLYRCLELMSQRRLAIKGIDADTQRIALMKGYERLKTDRDPLAWSPPTAAADESRLLDRIRRTNEARNKSILAHGFRLIRRDEEYRPFRAVVEEVFDRFYMAENLEQQTSLPRPGWHCCFDFVTLE